MFRKCRFVSNKIRESRVYSQFSIKSNCKNAPLPYSQSRALHSAFKNKPVMSLKDFMSKPVSEMVHKDEVDLKSSDSEVPYLDVSDMRGNNRTVYFEIYGCQMNVNDADVVWTILHGAGYAKADSVCDADVALIITCAIRDNAEKKIWERLRVLNELRLKRINPNLKVGILGCMAERLKEKLLEKDRFVDLVAGPDSYKDLPRLLSITASNQKAVNVLLSLDETYADVMPVRLNPDSVTAFISIMRGCDNMCTYCIVPFTRGRERSRPVNSILDEVRYLSDQGVKEVTLLGQNVNSYRDTSHTARSSNSTLAKGFKTVYKLKEGGLRFDELLDKMSDVNPEMRIRFTSPHPKDFADDVLEVIKEKHNICKSIHLPAQSGNSEVLERMRRGYTREAYLELVTKMRQYVPNMYFTSDFITGFCGETEAQFADTMSLVSEVRYSRCYTYAYSMREKTTAYRRYTDDVPDDVKLRRITELAKLTRQVADDLHSKEFGKRHLILVEGKSRRSDEQLMGKADCNVKVVIPKCNVRENRTSLVLKEIKPGDYVCVEITDTNSQIFKGTPLFHTTLTEYSSMEQEEIYSSSENICKAHSC